MIALDSSAIIDILAGTKKGEQIKKKVSEEALAVTSINVNEVLIGAKERERNKIHEFFENLDILSFDAASAFKSVEIEESLSKRGTKIGKMDIFIASICLVNNLPILTSDNHFKFVNELKVISIK